jgi:hypothetical protein
MSLRNLTQVIAALAFVAVPVLSWAGQAQPKASPFVGEYFVTENRHPICVPYTRNLNQFRRLDFNICDPRLSDKYPQFTRPPWEEIPFDLGLAETIFKNPPVSPQNAERWWQAWLKASEALRAEGKVKLWGTRIDIDGDGVVETIVRLDHLLAPNPVSSEQGWQLEQNPCPYRGKVYMLESANASMREGFNRTAYAITDILHFSGGLVSPGSYNAYYGVDWRLGLPSPLIGRRIGATRGLAVYALFNMGAAECCRIDWVPTGQYRPLKQSPR